MWTDAEQLYDYFRVNNDLLRFEKIDIDEAIIQTTKYADFLYELLLKNKNILDILFQPLSNNSLHIGLLPKYKSKKDGLDYMPLKLIPIIM